MSENIPAVLEKYEGANQRERLMLLHREIITMGGDGISVKDVEDNFNAFGLYDLNHLIRDGLVELKNVYGKLRLVAREVQGHIVNTDGTPGQTVMVNTRVNKGRSLVEAGHYVEKLERGQQVLQAFSRFIGVRTNLVLGVEDGQYTVNNQ